MLKLSLYTHTHTHNGVLLSHKKNETMPFATTWMDLEIITLSKVSQEKKDKYRMISLICGVLNMAPINFSTKRKQTQRTEGGGEWEFGISRCRIVFIE